MGNYKEVAHGRPPCNGRQLFVSRGLKLDHVGGNRRHAHPLVPSSQADNLANLSSGSWVSRVESAVVIPTYYLVAYRCLDVLVECAAIRHVAESRVRRVDQ